MIKCDNKYFRFKKLLMCFGGSSYLIQSSFHDICNQIAEECGVRAYTYLDFFLFIGSPKKLNKVIDVFVKSDVVFNYEKCTLIPFKEIVYLGLFINLKQKRIKITENEEQVVRGLRSRFRACYPGAKIPGKVGRPRQFYCFRVGPSVLVDSVASADCFTRF